MILAYENCKYRVLWIDFFFLVHMFIAKDITRGQPEGRDAQAGNGEGHAAPTSSLSAPLSQDLHGFTNLEPLLIGSSIEFGKSNVLSCKCPPHITLYIIALRRAFW